MTAAAAIHKNQLHALVYHAAAGVQGRKTMTSKTTMNACTYTSDGAEEPAAAVDASATRGG